MFEQFQPVSDSTERIPSANRWALLSAHLPGHAGFPIGVCLLTGVGSALQIRLRENWWQGLVEPDESSFWEAFQATFLEIAETMKPERWWEWLQSTPSHVIRSEVQQLLAPWSENASKLVDSLYDTYVVGKPLN